ncbi:cell division protein FtsL [Indioceanicola profundi]|uniref:cell division protein FtsL n=1 Tax=Indioceanicola profundi TaxID=2220096 RepID=UPI000E6A9795|nr:hypothetical protein [Indioceanicola profundi]
MIGKSILIWIGLAGTASVILYQTSYRVQEQADELAKLNRQIVAEQEAIQVLRAEWAYLNDPVRLERLVAEHTVLGPTKVEQIVTLDQLPLKPMPGIEEGQPPALLSSAPVRKPDAKPSGPVVLATYGGDLSYGAAR